MPRHKDGGPAFPHEYAGDDTGMTLRDYFAAHAPAEPQGWFEPVGLTPAVRPSDKLNLPEAMPLEQQNTLNNLASNWRGDPSFDLADIDHRIDEVDRLIDEHRYALVEFERAWRAFWDACNAYDFAYMRARLVQWPYAWADAQIAERERLEMDQRG